MFRLFLGCYFNFNRDVYCNTTQHNTNKKWCGCFFGCYFNFNLNVYCNTTQLNTKEKALGCVWVVSLISILIYIAIQHDLILRKNVWGLFEFFFEFNPGAYCNTTQEIRRKGVCVVFGLLF